MPGLDDMRPPVRAPVRVHGGGDARGVPRLDFSSNANACGPCPVALAAVQSADLMHYPDPAYAQLRRRLAAHHGVDPGRIAIAASGSEFIQRITAWAVQGGARRVQVPAFAYGDYAHAARAWGLALVEDGAQMCWLCEPSSPLGQPIGPVTPQDGAVTVLDCAYEPLRLSGESSLDDVRREWIWQLWSPNKALGLVGLRGAYAIAPHGAEPHVAALDTLAPSWPLGAHGVALLQAWCTPEAQRWLEASRATLRDWKARQLAAVRAIGWKPLDSDAHFFCARVPVADLPRVLDTLRDRHGIKLRDCASFGLPGHVRVAVLPPMAQDALTAAWHTLD